VKPNAVAVNLFDVFEVPVVAGRGFTAADVRPNASAVLVDDAFVAKVGGGNVVGRRIRYQPSGDGDVSINPWFEIVGVVPAFADNFATSGPQFSGPSPRLFHPAQPGTGRALTMMLRLGGTVSPQLPTNVRQTAATVDPGLRLEDIKGVVAVWDDGQRLLRLVATAIIAVMGSVLLLSAAGIYAMMSFTVGKRRREIGIRAALGADARRVLAGIFGRAAAQLGAGIAVGAILAVALDSAMGGQMMGGHVVVLLPTVIMMATVGLLAALGPARRGLSIQPTEALRDE